ncbi:uncharacterized protein LOC143143335 [Ptiloglossa arizonensis]|uniref:uncharacterized protein LOC143143335 n=1 Tax=Ptiloglossa arizonensis TaxID=3350558 RepID=UPI003FA0BDD2
MLVVVVVVVLGEVFTGILKNASILLEELYSRGIVAWVITRGVDSENYTRGWTIRLVGGPKSGLAGVQRPIESKEITLAQHPVISPLPTLIDAHSELCREITINYERTNVE